MVSSACISSCLRLYYSIQLIYAADMTFEVVNLAWTACLECAAAILVASFPVMPRLYRFIRGEKATAPSVYAPHGAANEFEPRSRHVDRGQSIRKFGSARSRMGQGEDDQAQLKNDWVPLEEGREYGLSNAEVEALERGMRSPGSRTPPAQDIRKTVKIETQFEPDYPQSDANQYHAR